MDHLIHTLIVDMLPYYQSCQDSQKLGFSGSDLAQKCWKELLMRTLEVNANSIHSMDDDHYYIQ